MKDLIRPTSMQGVHHTAALLGVATAFLVLFALLGLGVVDGWPIATFDQGVIALVRMLPDPPADAVMVFATYLASWQVIVAGTACCVTVFLASRRWAWSWTLLVSVVGDQLIVSAAKAVVGRVRPDPTHALMSASGASFPSGHTFAAMSFYGVIFWFAIEALPRARAAIAALALLLFAVIGISRVFLGAHWPSDVLGSYLLGVAWLLIVLAIYRVLEGRLVLDRVGMTRERWMLAVALIAVWLGVIVAMNYLHPGFTELQ